MCGLYSVYICIYLRNDLFDDLLYLVIITQFQAIETQATSDVNV